MHLIRNLISRGKCMHVNPNFRRCHESARTDSSICPYLVQRASLYAALLSPSADPFTRRILDGLSRDRFYISLELAFSNDKADLPLHARASSV